MIYYDRIVVSEGIDIHKASASKECDICHYRYFLDRGFKFEWYVCNGCRNVLIMSVKLNHIAISNINGADYCCITNELAKAICKFTTKC